jgi:AraC family transcriptional regulator
MITTSNVSVRGHAATKFVTGRQLASSSGRGWTNMLAERWSHAVGELPSTLPRDTEIDVLLSGRMRVERKGPGVLQCMSGRRGTFGISPAGIHEEFINIREPADDCLHVFLGAKPFADFVLQDLEIDPARATLRYEMVEYDPLIEQIALAINRELTAETSAGPIVHRVARPHTFSLPSSSVFGERDQPIVSQRFSETNRSAASFARDGFRRRAYSREFHCG